ncbi:MAG TPA: hypothetical protein VIW29_03445 [Polyangiaceae bacterium]
MKRRVWQLCGALCLWGCDDPLKPAQLIEGPRVLGARVSTETGEASLEPGAGAQAEVLLAGPEGPLAARFAYRLCEATGSARGVPDCVGESLAEGVAEAGAPELAFELPVSLGEGVRLALLGVACPIGEPDLPADPLEWRCSGAARQLRFSFDLWTRSSELTNQNPDLSELTLTISGEPVLLEDQQAAPSCAGGALELSSGTPHRVELQLGGAVREPGEALQLSHFSTRGDFENHYSFVSGEQAPTIALTWNAPRGEGPVKQYLVVRDGRGGVSWATWSFCIR